MSFATDMIRLSTLPCAFLAVFALAACDNRPIVGTEKTPFTVAGITIGTDKAAILALGRLGNCYQENERVASCRYTPEKEHVQFLGEPVDHITYEFMDDSPTVAIIKVFTVGSPISDLDVRMDWNMNTRCLDDYAAETISKFSREGWVAIDRIHEMRLRQYRGFACMSEDGRYVSGSSSSSGSGNTPGSPIEMFQLNSEAIEAMNTVFAIRDAIEAKNKALNASPGS